MVCAQNDCFSAAIQVTGHLVGRKEAVVTLDNLADNVVVVLAGERDQVTADQALARLASALGDVLDSCVAGKRTTLEAPAAGIVTRSTPVVRTRASSMQTGPLFCIAVDDEIELDAGIPSIRLPTLASGQRARVQNAGGSLRDCDKVRTTLADAARAEAR